MRRSVKLTVSVCVAAVVVMAATLSGPPKGSVEWHKEKYLVAWKRLNQKDWRGRLAIYLARKTKGPNFLFPTNREHNVWDGDLYVHRTALIDLGYLSDKVMVLSNISVNEASAFLQAMPRPLPGDERFTCIGFGSLDNTNAIWIIAPTSSLGLWEDCFRKFDLPEKSK